MLNPQIKEPADPEPRAGRVLTHDRPVYFRANSAIVEAAEAKARREGMSLSELMRAALRREVRETA